MSTPITEADRQREILIAMHRRLADDARGRSSPGWVAYHTRRMQDEMSQRSPAMLAYIARPDDDPYDAEWRAELNRVVGEA